MTSNRRSFLKETGIGVAAATVASRTLAAGGERLVLGVIGPGGMGTHHLTNLLARRDVTIAHVCDPDQTRLARAAAAVEKVNGRSPKADKDMRVMLADRSLDGVVIATPDHWHVPASLLALEAGKHVYVEKPVSHNIREGRLLIEAARKARKVVQTGTQSRSTAHVREAMQALREGIIGEVLVAKAWNSQRRRDIGKTKPSRPPATLDFNLWLGMAPEVPYRSNMLPGIWRWWYDFGCGDIGNDGVHDLDIARWGLGVNTHPTTVAALGGKYFFNDDQQFPDTQTVAYEYPGDGKTVKTKQLIFEQRIWSPYFQEGYENGNAFYGTRGMMILGKSGGWKVTLEKNKPGRESRGGRPNLVAHHTNWIECIRKGGTPNADAETGHLSAALCHLGNIACRVRRQLRFDPRTEQMVGDADANALVRRAYRAGHWAVPKGV